jgi:hypothetical protein
LNRALKVVVPTFFICLTALFASAKDIYIAQSAAGGNTGADCADAFAKSYLDTGSNWKPGNTYHLCGTFNASAGTSGYINIGASGTSANPITLQFENGAVLTAPYWSGGVININGNSYVTIDGGTNGVIQATANGTNLANQADNGECIVSQSGNATNVTVQNLTCANLYVDASVSDNGGQDTYGFDIWNTSNLVIQNNTIHDVKWATRAAYPNTATFSGLTYSGNDVYNMDHGFYLNDNGTTGGAQLSNVYVFGNTYGSMTNWDNTADNNHHDWMAHISASGSSFYNGIYIYNNIANGNIGANANAGVFSFPDPNTIENYYVFNNVMVNTSASYCWANGFISWYEVNSGPLFAYNNTWVSQSSCNDNGLDYQSSSAGLHFENNIVQHINNNALAVGSGTSVTVIDHNNYYQSQNWNWDGSLNPNNLVAWQSDCSCDAHANIGNPNLTASFHLSNSSSAAWQAGTNFYSLCGGQPVPGLGALCSDAAGVARPSSGNWDMGAYYDSGTSVPNPPTGLAATVQ